MKLSDIELTHDQVLAFQRWCGELHKHYQEEAAMWDANQAEEALAEERARRIVKIAQEWADRSGPLFWVADEYHATAAYASWFDLAGYMDVDEHFSPDDSDQELWETAYANRLAELRRRQEPIRA